MLDLENYGLGKAILFYCVVNSKDLSYSNHKIVPAFSWPGLLMARGRWWRRSWAHTLFSFMSKCKYQSLPKVTCPAVRQSRGAPPPWPRPPPSWHEIRATRYYAEHHPPTLYLLWNSIFLLISSLYEETMLFGCHIILLFSSRLLYGILWKCLRKGLYYINKIFVCCELLSWNWPSVLASCAVCLNLFPLHI